MTERVAVAGWFGAGNLGDELILRALLEALRARGTEPVAVSIDPGHTWRSHGVDSILHRHPAQFPSLARALRGCDGMVLAGGVVQSETSPWNIPFHVSRLHAAAAAGCPVAAVGIGVGRVGGALNRSTAGSSRTAPAGIGRMGGALNRLMARRALGRLSSLVVRDEDSALRLREWGLRTAVVGADPVAALEPEAVEPDDTMCVILRPPNRSGMRTYASKASRAVSEWGEGLSQVARAVDAAAAATGLRPRLAAFEARFDDLLHRAVANRMTAPAELIAPSLDTVLTEVGRSRLVITMRYHGAMAALLHNRPAVLLDYSPKMAALAAEGGGWAAVVDPHRLDTDGIVAAASKAFEAAERAPEALAALRRRLKINDAGLDILAGCQQ